MQEGAKIELVESSELEKLTKEISEKYSEIISTNSVQTTMSSKLIGRMQLCNDQIIITFSELAEASYWKGHPHPVDFKYDKCFEVSTIEKNVNIDDIVLSKDSYVELFDKPITKEEIVSKIKSGETVVCSIGILCFYMKNSNLRFRTQSICYEKHIDLETGNVTDPNFFEDLAKLVLSVMYLFNNNKF